MAASLGGPAIVEGGSNEQNGGDGKGVEARRGRREAPALAAHSSSSSDSSLNNPCYAAGFVSFLYVPVGLNWVVETFANAPYNHTAISRAIINI